MTLLITLLKKLFNKKNKAFIKLNVPSTFETLNDKQQAIIETIEFMERNINIIK